MRDHKYESYTITEFLKDITNEGSAYDSVQPGPLNKLIKHLKSNSKINSNIKDSLNDIDEFVENIENSKYRYNLSGNQPTSYETLLFVLAKLKIHLEELNNEDDVKNNIIYNNAQTQLNTFLDQHPSIKGEVDKLKEKPDTLKQSSIEKYIRSIQNTSEYNNNSDGAKGVIDPSTTPNPQEHLSQNKNFHRQQQAASIARNTTPPPPRQQPRNQGNDPDHVADGKAQIGSMITEIKDFLNKATQLNKLRNHLKTSLGSEVSKVYNSLQNINMLTEEINDVNNHLNLPDNSTTLYQALLCACVKLEKSLEVLQEHTKNRDGTGIKTLGDEAKKEWDTFLSNHQHIKIVVNKLKNQIPDIFERRINESIKNIAKNINDLDNEHDDNNNNNSHLKQVNTNNQDPSQLQKTTSPHDPVSVTRTINNAQSQQPRNQNQNPSQIVQPTSPSPNNTTKFSGTTSQPHAGPTQQHQQPKQSQPQKPVSLYSEVFVHYGVLQKSRDLFNQQNKNSSLESFSTDKGKGTVTYSGKDFKVTLSVDDNPSTGEQTITSDSAKLPMDLQLKLIAIQSFQTDKKMGCADQPLIISKVTPPGSEIDNDLIMPGNNASAGKIDQNTLNYIKACFEAGRESVELSGQTYHRKDQQSLAAQNPTAGASVTSSTPHAPAPAPASTHAQSFKGNSSTKVSDWVQGQQQINSGSTSSSSSSSFTLNENDDDHSQKNTNSLQKTSVKLPDGFLTKPNPNHTPDYSHSHQDSENESDEEEEIVPAPSVPGGRRS